MKRMTFRKIGDWTETNERGFYVEAVDIPKGQPRYMQVGSSFLDADSVLQPQDAGKDAEGKTLISFLVDDDDLLERIN